MKKNTVLITGASRGIGKAAALAFAREEYNIVLNYFRSKEECESLGESIAKNGGNAIAVCADVSNGQEVRKMVQRVKETFGQIDVLVNNAGIAQQKLFLDIHESEWDNMFSVNMKGMFYCCQSVLPYMISQRKGKIINLSSVWGICGASCEVHYSASKAAVIGFTKALAKEVGPCNIQVNCVAPGVIETDMNADLNEFTIEQLKENTPLGRIGRAEEIADCILYLASDKADFITGQVISPNGGFVI